MHGCSESPWLSVHAPRLHSRSPHGGPTRLSSAFRVRWPRCRPSWIGPQRGRSPSSRFQCHGPRVPLGRPQQHLSIRPYGQGRPAAGDSLGSRSPLPTPSGGARRALCPALPCPVLPCPALSAPGGRASSTTCPCSVSLHPTPRSKPSPLLRLYLSARLSPTPGVSGARGGHAWPGGCGLSLAVAQCSGLCLHGRRALPLWWSISLCLPL